MICDCELAKADACCSCEGDLQEKEEVGGSSTRLSRFFMRKVFRPVSSTRPTQAQHVDGVIVLCLSDWPIKPVSFSSVALALTLLCYASNFVQTFLLCFVRPLAQVLSELSAFDLAWHPSCPSPESSLLAVIRLSLLDCLAGSSLVKADS